MYNFLSLFTFDEDAHGEFRSAALKILRLDGLAVDTVLFKHADLICEHYLRLEIKVGRHFCERVILVRPGLGEGVVGLLQVLGRACRRGVRGQSQGVDEHTQSIGSPKVGTAVADSADIYFLAAAESTCGKERSRQEIACRRYAKAPATLGDFGAYSFNKACLAPGAVTLFEIGKYAAGAFAACHLSVKEVSGGGKFLPFFRLFLVGGIIEVRICFI